MAIWLQISVQNGQTAEQISERFEISRQQVMEYLNFLIEAQLVEEVSGVYRMQSQHIHVKLGSQFLGRHHSNWRVKSLQRIDDLKDEELTFTSPFSISKKDFSRIREELLELIKNTSTIIKDSPAEDIACINLDLFWVKK